MVTEPNPDVDCLANCHCQPIPRPNQSKAQVHTLKVILVHSSTFEWLLQDKYTMQQLTTAVQDGLNAWVPRKDLPSQRDLYMPKAAD